jgi:hypothetical protein
MRRRVGSAVVVAAVAAVAILALVDAVNPLRSEPAQPLDPSAAAQLAERGFRGTLVYTDRDCELHALALPDLLPAPEPEGEGGCEFSLSPDGRRVAPASVRWSAAGQRCEAVCAWRGEELTYVRGGAIRSDAELLVTRNELERALRAHPTAPARLEIAELRIRDVAWLSRDIVVALLQVGFPGRPPENAAVIAGFERGRLAWERVHFGQFERLVVAPGGDVLPEPPPLPFLFITRALRLAGPFDWSPDGRGMAVATRASVFVVDLPSERHVRIPVTARDLAWR